MASTESTGFDKFCRVSYNMLACAVILSSASDIYSLSKTYSGLDEADKNECTPFTIWKIALLSHVIFIFISMSITANIVDRYVAWEEGKYPNQSSIEQQPWSQKLSRVIGYFICLSKAACLFIHGPILLIESCLCFMLFEEI
jgi:hypothetical protein